MYTTRQKRTTASSSPIESLCFKLIYSVLKAYSPQTSTCLWLHGGTTSRVAHPRVSWVGWRPGVTKFKSSNQRARGKVWTTWPSQYHRIIILHIGVKCWAGEKHRTQGSFVPGSNRAGCTAYIKVIWGQKKNMIDAVTNRVMLRAERKALFAIKYWDSLFVSFIYFYLLYVMFDKCSLSHRRCFFSALW